MSKKLPAVKPKQLIRFLEQRGWELDRTRGSHYILKHTGERRKITVPMHNRDLGPGLLLAILKNVGVDRDEFIDAL